MIPALEALDALVRSNVSPRQKLRFHIDGLIKFNWDHPYLSGLLMRLIQEASAKEAEEISNRFLQPIVRSYERIIEQCVASGDMAEDIDPVTFYFNMIGACNPFLSTRIVFDHCFGGADITDDLRRRYASQTVETLTRGLTAPTG
ncbi:hypothetical protein BH10PSE1_BH10PSE1_08470 [soil metagenome]